MTTFNNNYSQINTSIIYINIFIMQYFLIEKF